MGTSRRISAQHVADVLKRQQEIAPELFREHTEAELLEAEALIRHLDRVRAQAAMQPDPQLQLAIG